MEGKTITIKVKHLTDKVYEVEVNSGLTVMELKEVLEQKTTIPAAEQKIIFKGKKQHKLLNSIQAKCSRTTRLLRKTKLKTVRPCIS